MHDNCIFKQTNFKQSIFIVITIINGDLKLQSLEVDQCIYGKKFIEIGFYELYS